MVVDLAVIYGAFATGLWDRQQAFVQSPNLQLNRGHLRAGLGGLLMGYGGFLAYGCNISSFVGGVMSFILHAWVWLAAAFIGSAAWLRLTEGRRVG
ncbi:MAG: YeeE/YedE thiosulfate transporter family protein [Cyanobium sp.]